MVEFGGLAWLCTDLAGETVSCDAFVQRGGRIPARSIALKTDKKGQKLRKREFLALFMFKRDAERKIFCLGCGFGA